MDKFEEIFETGMKFHGHKCPAMTIGLRAGMVALKALGVGRAPDKELQVFSETGEGHIAGCFLDGIMTATGCTYGKSNILKLYHNKLAFTLIDNRTGRSVRVSLNPRFFSQVLNSPFVQQRKAGVAPQNIPAEVADPLIEKIINLPEEGFLDIGEIIKVQIPKLKSVFEAKHCSKCGEMTFVNKLQNSPEGQICTPCTE